MSSEIRLLQGKTKKQDSIHFACSISCKRALNVLHFASCRETPPHGPGLEGHFPDNCK